MIRKTLFILSAALSAYSYSHEQDDPLLASARLDKLEKSDNQTRLETNAWVGKDINKLWVKADVARNNSNAEHAEFQALFSHAFTTYWDVQTGIRRDTKPSPSKNWAVIGVQGLAPYFFEMDAAVFVGEEGRTAARVKIEYDMLFTQRLVLSPDIELNFYGQNDAATETGSGLSNANAGLRLRYEIRRELAPYIGVNWSKKFGNTARLTQGKNEIEADTKNTEWVVGIRAWF